MLKTRHVRADGRYLYYYCFDRPPPDVVPVEEPRRDDDPLELRWNPLLQEQVIVSTGRQERTFLPPAEGCPLCPTPADASRATEIPSTDYEIVVFENRFPGLRSDARSVADASSLERRRRATGFCEVVVYSSDHERTLASMSLEQAHRLVDVWADRYAELATQPEVAYVFIFENRGREIGVTLTHPHGQIYALPFVPPRAELEHAAAAAHYGQTGRCLMCDLVAEETAHGRRIVGEAPGFVAYVPFAPRMPYEVHVAATGHRASLLDLADAERESLALLLRRLQTSYDALWDFAMPYTMSMHQRAADNADRPGEHLHVEFAPPYRSRDRLKYLAGVETGAGTYLNDVAPERTAAELRAALHVSEETAHGRQR